MPEAEATVEAVGHEASVWRIEPTGPLEGRVAVPADKSIAHRALLLAALAEGRSELSPMDGVGLDVERTAAALRAMGVRIERGEGGRWTVHGVGLRGLRRPASGLLDCGNSGTTMRLLAGVLVGQSFGVRLIGDASLQRRPMRRIVEPLRARGALVDGRHLPDGGVVPPLTVAPLVEGEVLGPLEHSAVVPSAQVKGALLLSGLYAEGPTALAEPMLSRDHTERALLALGVPLQTVGPLVLLDPAGFRGGWEGFRWRLPGDVSSAAFLWVAALVTGGRVTVPDVGLNPTRLGLLEVLREMGAGVQVVPRGETGPGEPFGEVTVEAPAGGLRAARVGGERLLRMIDEVPAFCALAAVARGVSEVRDAAELRVKESDRLARLAELLEAFGVRVERLEGGLRIEGRAGAPLRAAQVSVGDDHRLAMAAAVMACAADGPSRLEGAAAAAVSWPGFAGALRDLGGTVLVRPGEEADR